MAARPTDNEIRAALQAYFGVLQSNPSAEEMRTVVTDDFKTGFAGGYMWQGRCTADFLAARAGFVDERATSTRCLNGRTCRPARCGSRPA